MVRWLRPQLGFLFDGAVMPAGSIEFDADLAANSAQGIETKVRMGHTIGTLV